MKHPDLVRLVFVLGLPMVVLLIVLLASGSHNRSALQSSYSHKAYAAPLAKQVSYRGLPVELKIPAISVDTQIEYMGDSSNGDMAVPDSLVDVGWYKYGPLPGDTGSAVIAGHVVGFNGEPSVFGQLDMLKKGDKVLVVDAKGRTASFTVRLTKTYDPVGQYNEVFNSTSGVHLNLITCSGGWDASHLHYLKRLVVFTDSST